VLVGVVARMGGKCEGLVDCLLFSYYILRFESIVIKHFFFFALTSNWIARMFYLSYHIQPSTLMTLHSNNINLLSRLASRGLSRS